MYLLGLLSSYDSIYLLFILMYFLAIYEIHLLITFSIISYMSLSEMVFNLTTVILNIASRIHSGLMKQ